MNNKKNWSKILLILGVVIGVLGVSYALWLVTFSSTNNNTITATCFNVSFTDQNNISIEKAYPLLDKDGKKLTPYEFTITNNCDSYVKYDINLEILNNSTLTNMDYIKLMLDDETHTLVSSYNVTTKTLSNASTAYKIKTSYLDAKESKTYNLRLWLDENVTGETEGVQNNTFASKITVNASYTEEFPIASEKIIELAKIDTTNLEYDETNDNNLRYIGANPNNYIKVDDELWRIVGVMNNVDDGTGVNQKRVKIIRDSSIGYYSWDTTADIKNSGYGSKSWEESVLMKLLNPGYESEEVGGSLYWNKQSGYCYVSSNKTIGNCSFKSTGIKDTLKSMIADATWSVGRSLSSLTTAEFYTDEHTDSTWTGKIGILSASDYGYATGGSETKTRASCLETKLLEWKDGGNDWNNRKLPKF